MSNVPDLDDEDGILRNRIREFKQALDYKTLNIIHSYPSLALLSQTIFTLERKRSRLAKEYRRLKEEIVDKNDEDAEAVERFLDKLNKSQVSMHHGTMSNVENRLESIREKHNDNGQVIFRLGLVRKGQGNINEAVALFDRAWDLGCQTSAVLVERATCYSTLSDRERTTQDVRQLLERPDLGEFGLYQAVQLLDSNDQKLLTQVPQSKAFQPLAPGEKFIVLRETLKKGAIKSSVDALRVLVADLDTSNGLREVARMAFVLSLMELSKVDQVLRMYGPTRPSIDDLEIQDAFNFAMAEWAHTGDIPRDLFARVLELDSTDHEIPHANYMQCLAVSSWAIGDTIKAEECIAKAEEYAQETKKTEFSCWRYQTVSREEFLSDCQDIRKLIATGEGRPIFFPTKQKS